MNRPNLDWMTDASDIDNQPETKRVKRDIIMGVDAQAELDSLDRILSRLAFTTDGAALETVLSKLIPIMIGKMDSSVELPKGVQRQVQQKVLDILSHANKRMDGLPNLKLPIASVWQAYRDSKNSVGQNIGLVYLGKAFDRCGSDGLGVVGEVVQGIHARGGHQSVLMMHVFRALRWYPDSLKNTSDSMNVKGILKDGKDLDVFMRHAVMLALYIPPSSRTRVAGGARVVPGLSESDMKVIEGRGELSVDDVEKMMVGVLEFVSRAEPSPEDSMVFLLCASSSPYEEVRKKSEFMFAKTCVVDTARPTVDVEKRAVMKPLFDMYLGSMEDQVLPTHLKRSPVNQSLKSRILGILCRSTVACNMNPEAIMVIHDCIFGETSNLSLKQQGMQFAVHVLRHADASTIRIFAPSIIRQCLEILEGGSGIASLRGFAYQCLGQLAQRDPASLQDMKMELTKRCFEALEIEGPGVRASVQETINCLANCFQDDADRSYLVWAVLEGYCYSENSSMRQTALQWIIWIFKFSDTRARYICSVLCSDGNINISDLAREGLDVGKVVHAQSAKFGNATNDAAAMPTLKNMIKVVEEKHQKVFNGSHDGLSTLFLPAPSLEALLGFLHSLPLDQSDAEATRGYFAILSSCLIRNAPGSLQNVSLDSLLYCAALCSEQFLDYFGSKTNIFEDMLNHVDDRVSCKSARLLGFLRQSMPSSRLEQICSRLHEIVAEVLANKPKKQEEVIGALFATGFLEAWKGTPTNASSSASLLEDPRAALFALVLSDELKNNVLRATALMCIAYSTFGNELEEGDISLILEEALPKLKPYIDGSISISAVEALGLIGMNARVASYVTTIVDEILEFYTSKDEKLLEKCGDALVCVWGGTNASREQYLLLHATMANGNAHPQSPHSDGEKKAIRDKILKFIVNSCIASSRSEARMAGAIWLLRILEGAPQTPEISDNVAEIQKAFCLLLGDSNERTRDLASKGVTYCYQTAKDDVREDLVASLVGILSGGSDSGKWMRPNHVEGSTQIFEEGSLGSLPNQSGGISTYKEICSLATDLGQPDLIYQFMNLAGHQAAADATRGAAYGIVSVASLAGDALKPHIDSLIPRLFRSTFDPNPAVRDSMRHIWVVLVDNPKDALKEHLSETLSLLTKDMTKQQWRVRESAALATADILQGLSWGDIKGFFPTILKCCFRIIDDVKESVRVAGQTLVRSITSLSIRLTDADSTASSDSNEFLSVVFPILIGTGISSSLSDIRAISIGLITRLIKSAGPNVLKDKMQDIVPPLLESLSGLEDSRLNYLEQHVNRLGLDADRFEEERIRFSQQNPIGEALDLCSKSVDGKSFCDMSSSFITLVRTAVGSSTKSGTANFIVACTRRIGTGVSPAAFTLMRSLYDALKMEKSASVRKSYATAYACLSKYAPKSKIDATLDSWLESCKNEDSDKDFMILTGIILKSMSLESTDLFIRYADDIAPIAFMARYSDPSVASVWTNVWEEITTATGSGIRGHALSISNTLLEALDSSHWVRKKAAGDGIVCLCENAGDLLANQIDLIASTVLKALPGRLWDGKEVLLKSLAAIVMAADRSQLTTVGGGEENIVSAFATACQKQKLVYRTEAIIQTGRVLRHLNDKDFYPQIWPTLNDLLSQHSERLREARKGEDDESTQIPSIKIILECLSSLWCQGSESLAQRDASWNSVTATALLPILQYCEKIEDRKAALQFYSSLVQCGDETSIPEDTVTKMAEEALALMSSSRAESLRSLGSDLLHEIIRKGMRFTPSISELRSRLNGIESSEKSAAVRSKIIAIIATLP